MQSPQSCDTFVVLPPFTENGNVIFGKNSDRPQHEVQEVVYFKGGRRPPKLKCTFIMIDETPAPINNVILSKPAWMWGAEMGANDKNVAIGNEAVWTNYNEGDGDGRVKRLLGMDLVRLGLERGGTAEEALDVITSLLEQYGQGGPCAEDDEHLYYHNSFLIADCKQAWVLETSGKFWVAELVHGYRNISNGLTITTHFDKHSSDLHAKTQRVGLWNGQGEFNFSKIFASGGDVFRQEVGKNLLQKGINDNKFNTEEMMNILRQKDHRICRGCDDPFPTQGSQVSRLSPGISVHYFTATPDTSMSFFKPFVFTPGASASQHTASPSEPLREHYLYTVHKDEIIEKQDSHKANQMIRKEIAIVADLDKRISQIETGSSDINILDNVMHQYVEAEITLYTSVDNIASNTAVGCIQGDYPSLIH